MNNLITETEKLLEAIKDLHPNFNMGDPKQEKLYLSYHNVRNELTKLK